MSRAIGKKLKAALSHGDQWKVFEDITNLLITPCTPRLEIEILMDAELLGSDVNYMQESNAVGFSKLRLAQSFIVGRNILTEHIARKKTASDELLRRATAAILLFDPEHLTAANTRKRILSKVIEEGEDIEKTARIGDECNFVDTLLTARLHRHTKSPNLWNHRRWVIEQYRNQSIDVTASRDIQDIITVSGERHAKNYYAWCHARYLVDAEILPRPNKDEILQELIEAIKKWCLSHHNDISGWQFLMFLLDKQTSETPGIFNETLRLTESFKWRNESVWYFFRYTASSPSLTDDDRDELSRIRTALWQTADEGGQEKRTLEAAQRLMSAT